MLQNRKDLHRYGSAHPNSLNMAMCDGSVHAISYSIAGKTFRRLGGRVDGQIVDPKKAI